MSQKEVLIQSLKDRVITPFVDSMSEIYGIAVTGKFSDSDKGNWTAWSATFSSTSDKVLFTNLFTSYLSKESSVLSKINFTINHDSSTSISVVFVVEDSVSEFSISVSDKSYPFIRVLAEERLSNKVLPTEGGSIYIDVDASNKIEVTPTVGSATVLSYSKPIELGRGVTVTSRIKLTVPANDTDSVRTIGVTLQTTTKSASETLTLKQS